MCVHFTVKISHCRLQLLNAVCRFWLQPTSILIIDLCFCVESMNVRKYWKNFPLQLSRVKCWVETILVRFSRYNNCLRKCRDCTVLILILKSWKHGEGLGLTQVKLCWVCSKCRRCFWGGRSSLLLWRPFSNNDHLLFVSFQLVRRIYKGIPLQLRGEVWCLLLDVPKIKEEKKDFYEVRSRDLAALSPTHWFINSAQHGGFYYSRRSFAQIHTRATLASFDFNKLQNYCGQDVALED